MSIRASTTIITEVKDGKESTTMTTEVTDGKKKGKKCKKRAHGNKTLACAALASGAFTTMWFDPTGASASTFVAASTGAAAGATYHCVRKVSHVFRKKKVGDSQEEEIDPVELEREIEEIIRKLASSFLGVTISSTLAVVLPHALVGAAVNAGEFTAQLKNLRKLAKANDMKVRDLLQSVSKMDVALQITAGFVLKAAFTTLFLGQDFELWAQGIGHALESVSINDPGAVASLQELALDHKEMTSHGLLGVTTEIANGPGDAITQILTDGNATPVWSDGTGFTAAFGIGLAGEATELMIARVVEEPCHQALNSRSPQLNRLLGKRHSVKVVALG